MAGVGQLSIRDARTAPFRRSKVYTFPTGVNVALAAETTLTVGVYSDATRPSAGTAGRVIFNTTDANLNIDNGTNWILPSGTIT